MSEPASALHLLEHVFGYHAFRGEQAAIVEQVASGGDALVLMPTGGGKSLCYQIPSLLREGCGVVVSPLIALMQDQVDALKELGVAAAFLNSTLTPDEARAVEQAFVAGELQMIYVAPERLVTPRFVQLMQCAKVALFAIDEAHCVSQWGHDFRPEYLQLSLLAEMFPGVPRIALTATADHATREEMVQRLRLEDARQFVSSFDRPNLRYTIVEKKSGREQLLEFIRRLHEGDSGIVYCLSRKKVEETATWLRSKEIKALPYHAGLEASTRAKHQQIFIRDEGVVMVATIAFGMGIDKPDVRFVAHLDLPKSIENYYQETGRGGRDGLPANAWLTYGLNDVMLLSGMIESSGSPEQQKLVERRKLEAMLGLVEATDCRRQTLLGYFGEASKPCGNCDNCLNPPQLIDQSEAAKMALSCVFRTGNRFGVGHLVDVLQGKSNDKVRQHFHDKVTTFGIGKGVDEPTWRAVFRQLVARGALRMSPDGHGGLALTDSARPYLRGETPLFLRARTEKFSYKAKETGFDNPADDALWQALRKLRKHLADEQNVPAYVIFGDATLREMVKLRPGDEYEFSRISGVGDRKLEKYGKDFLAEIAKI
ncbi:ATP-dependent DNA helicase RecQ [Andreprevotia sp. IGB-42]|uniref:DNA helicase RecQ n=1 Tax=Andreprevotia sp. IGB-42 TaxID=2497473 RepID=UPI00135C620D|nr:DNA helicase RecQ [Andreprevotia sp. IGB-42]KAF0812956.1 ATP-dependent DNA helicase RecQ [Andreprevotia sp. IGB-42]